MTSTWRCCGFPSVCLSCPLRISPSFHSFRVRSIDRAQIHIHNIRRGYGFVVTQRILLLRGLCRLDRLKEVEIGFGVNELFDLPDLQAPVFVGGEVDDGDRFAVHINPHYGFRFVGGL